MEKLIDYMIKKNRLIHFDFPHEIENLDKFDYIKKIKDKYDKFSLDDNYMQNRETM